MSGRAAGSWRFVQMLEALLREGHPVRFRAPGWSMHPTIRNGEIITVAPVGRAPIRTGDVLLYREGGAAIAHRVVRVRSGAADRPTFVLRGDAADSCDQPIAVEQVLGRVLAVERAGRAIVVSRVNRIWSRTLARALRAARIARMRVAAAIRPLRRL